MNNKANKDRIVKDLKSMQSIGFESMTDALHVKLKDKRRNETAFWKQFEESYWNGSRKCWLSS